LHTLVIVAQLPRRTPPEPADDHGQGDHADTTPPNRPTSTPATNLHQQARTTVNHTGPHG
jgi:hypothetical protein